MYDAVLLDFYGTVVHEDDRLIESICARVAESAAIEIDPRSIGSYWWSTFSTAFSESYGSDFQTQRKLERASLVATLGHFGSPLDPDQLGAELFEHWCAPPIFDDAKHFLANVETPVVIVSNIDRDDLEEAMGFHGLAFEAVVTSDDVRSYKPRPEIFEAALARLDVDRRRVLHVGDSLTSDVAGANGVGIDVAWVNRKGKSQLPNVRPTYEVEDLSGVLVDK